jgi:Fic family protein
MHSVFLDSVRGKDKTPGEFRKDQNWIGSPGCKIDEASFVPPSPLRLNDFLENWQGYVQLRDFDPLVQAGIVHAQFELLHPFKDGNGRIGRLLIPLFLFQQKILSSPMFYLSAYLEEHRDEYYSRLQAISWQGDWNGWIEFFLQAVHAQAHENSERVKATMALYEEMKLRIAEVTHSRFAIQVLDALFDRPVFQASDFVQRTEIRRATALGLLRQLRENGVIAELRPGAGSRAGTLIFAKLLNIAEGRKVF